MSAPDVNTTGYGFSTEASPGVLDTPLALDILEPNDVSKWNAELTSVRRQPISKDRMPRASTSVDLDSMPGLVFDLTAEHLRIMLASAMLALPVGREYDVFRVTGVTATGYTIPDDDTVIPDGRLVFAAGFAQTANNGLKLLAGTSTDVELKTTGLVEEAAIPAAQNATVEICGVQGAEADFRLTNTGNLTTEVAGLDMTTLGWVVGQPIHLGDPASGAAFRFDSITDDMYANGEGFARIRSIAAHLVTLDKNETLTTTDAGGGKTIRILYGAFFREWPEGHANFRKWYNRIEMTLPGLDGGSDSYSSAQGNILNELVLQFPLTALATMTATWVGTDTPVPVTTRETWTAIREPRLVAPLDTTTSYRRKRLCTHEGVDVLSELKDLTITISNGATPEKVQGRYGAFKINLGDRTAGGESSWLLDSPESWTVMREHTKITLDIAMGGEDGGFYLDLPTVRLSGGDPGLERNTTVTTNAMIMAEKNQELGYMVGFSRFPYLP